MIRRASSWTLTSRLLGILFVGASAACQQELGDDATSSSALSVNEPSPVVVVMGGFNSCGTNASGSPTPEGGLTTTSGASSRFAPTHSLRLGRNQR